MCDRHWAKIKPTIFTNKNHNIIVETHLLRFGTPAQWKGDAVNPEQH